MLQQARDFLQHSIGFVQHGLRRRFLRLWLRRMMAYLHEEDRQRELVADAVRAFLNAALAQAWSAWRAAAPPTPARAERDAESPRTPRWLQEAAVHVLPGFGQLGALLFAVRAVGPVHSHQSGFCWSLRSPLSCRLPASTSRICALRSPSFPVQHISVVQCGLLFAHSHQSGMM